jgi:hypothetical protein
MGSFISLGVGHLEVDWGKNSFLRDHSKLYLRTDLADALYYYADNYRERKPAYVRTLSSVVRRLELLGYTLSECRRLYDNTAAAIPDYYPALELSFDMFARALRSADVTNVNPSEDEDYDLGEYAAKAILSDPEFTKTETQLASLTRDDGTFFENLDPYVILRLLAENPANLDQDVIWRFSDVIDGGWVGEKELFEGLSDGDRYLIVTEGSSDSSILRTSLPMVQEDVADFFAFIDMSENYPFTGTGNVVRFCQGLVKIHIQNKVLVVLDNDTAGRDAFQRIQKLSLPSNMRVTVLPDLENMRHCATLGPSGQAVEDVNGRAVSIECFLDLKYESNAPPVVRWTSFNPTLCHYQGELVRKDEYARRFFDNAGKDARYDLRNLTALWQDLCRACVADQSDTRAVI